MGRCCCCCCALDVCVAPLTVVRFVCHASQGDSVTLTRTGGDSGTAFAVVRTRALGPGGCPTLAVNTTGTSLVTLQDGVDGKTATVQWGPGTSGPQTFNVGACKGWYCVPQGAGWLLCCGAWCVGLTWPMVPCFVGNVHAPRAR